MRRWWLAAPAVGAALATAAALVNHVPIALGEGGEARSERGLWSQIAEFASLILDSGWAWAAAAVAAGWLVSDRARPWLVAAVSGVVTLLTATLVYSGWEDLLSGGGYLQTFWLVGGLVLGPVLGLVGAAIRRPGPVGTVAALVVPAGAALNMVVLPPPAESLVAQPVMWLVWAGAAVAAVLVLVRRPVLAGSGGRTRSPAAPPRPETPA
ncbi:DUF6518 family protein [Actinoplanes sp. NBC_00393]|uniref:DUF6518 family protein n=1 Tax=Actinoplanes sp. NBC_00393 TaxID=2975953 RepID=UPI002E1F2A17